MTTKPMPKTIAEAMKENSSMQLEYRNRGMFYGEDDDIWMVFVAVNGKLELLYKGRSESKAVRALLTGRTVK